MLDQHRIVYCYIGLGYVTRHSPCLLSQVVIGSGSGNHQQINNGNGSSPYGYTKCKQYSANITRKPVAVPGQRSVSIMVLGQQSTVLRSTNYLIKIYKLPLIKINT